jgi:hypothetical protein
MHFDLRKIGRLDLDVVLLEGIDIFRLPDKLRSVIYLSVPGIQNNRIGDKPNIIGNIDTGSLADQLTGGSSRFRNRAPDHI